MKEWLISIVAVVLLLVLMEVLLSEGNTKKYVQGVIRLILIVVIVFPIINIIKKDITYQDIIPTTHEEDITDQSFLDKIYVARYHSAELDIQKKLQSKGIKGAVVSIDIYYADSYLIEISNVYVDLHNAVISIADENIFINDIIIDVVKTNLIVDGEKIIVYGQSKIYKHN